MYAYGTSCQCNNCGKKWVITYKDTMKYNEALRIAKTNINIAIPILENYKNGDMLQYGFCPECRSPIVQSERFYYEADNQYNYIRGLTEAEYYTEINRINTYNQQLREKNKLDNYHFWTIVMLILCPSIGFIMLWFDKKINERKRKLACKIFAWFIGVGLIFSLIISVFYEEPEPINVNALYTNQYDITATDINSGNTQKIKSGDIFWVYTKQPSKYIIENNGITFEIPYSSKINELPRSLTIDEYVNDITFLTKPIKVSVNGIEYTTESMETVGYAIEDEIEFCGSLATSSFGHEFNIIGKLINSESNGYYIVKLNENKYAYIGMQYITTDKNEFDTIVVRREEEKRIKNEEELKKKEEETRAKYSIYEENGVTYATANDIVAISKHDTSSKQYFNLDGEVCVTGKIKSFSTTPSYVIEKVTGNFRTYKMIATSDTIYLDNDKMESFTGITVNIKSKINEDRFNDVVMYIAQAEEYSTAKTDLYLFNDAYYWMEKQEELGNLKNGATVRVYGEGSWELFDTYDINCSKIEIINDAGEVISVFEYK